MSFGLKNASATFQRMMDNAFRGLIGNKCFAYIGDIAIFRDTIQQHNQNMEDVLQRVKQLGLRLEPSKCEYSKPAIGVLKTHLNQRRCKPNHRKSERDQKLQRT